MLLKYLKGYFLISVLLLAGCQNVPNQPSPTSKRTETKMPSTPDKTYTPLVPTQDVTKTSTIEPTRTLQASNMSFANMKSGKYILIEADDQYGNDNLYVLTVNGEVEQKILIDHGVWSTSNDGKQIYFLSFTNEKETQQAKIFDVSTNRWNDINVNLPRECQSFVQSPDAQMTIFDCYDSGNDLYLLKKNSNLLEKITDCRENREECTSAPGWSPDGKWFMYYRVNQIRSGDSPYNFRGSYIFNTDCLNDNSCLKKQIGPILYYNLFWLENNKVIEYTANQTLGFHPFKDGVILPSNKGIKIDVRDDQRISLLYPSPDKQYFVYAYDNNDYTERIISVLSSSTNTSQTLMKLHPPDSFTIVGWIVVP